MKYFVVCQNGELHFEISFTVFKASHKSHMWVWYKLIHTSPIYTYIVSYAPNKNRLTISRYTAAQLW